MNILLPIAILIYVTTGISEGKIHNHNHEVSAESSSKTKSEEVSSPEEKETHDQHVMRTDKDGRRSFRNCLKKGAKLCGKACIKAYKAVCKKRKCTSRAKKTLKSECKRSCQLEFLSNGGRNRYSE